MPRKGNKCITINEKVHEDIKKKAKETNCKMSEYIEYLIAKEKNNVSNDKF